MTNIIEDKMWEEYMESDEFREEIRRQNSKIPVRKRKILSASEARAKLNKFIEEDNTELEEIMGKIDAAINRKQDYTYISATVKEYTLNKFRELGYHISDIVPGDRPFDTDTRKISW